MSDPMNRSTPGLPVHHQLPEFSQTHVHRVVGTILLVQRKDGTRAEDQVTEHFGATEEEQEAAFLILSIPG